MKVINVAIIDQHPILRLGLSGFLDEDHQIQVGYQVGNYRELIRKIGQEKRKPDVIIIDFQSAKKSSYLARKRLLDVCPESKLIYLNDLETEQHMKKIVPKYADAYVSKWHSKATLQESVKNVFKTT